MAIIKKTTVVAKPTPKTKSPVAKALSKGLSESRMEAKPAAKPVVKATITKVMVDKKTGKATTSAPVAMKSKSITEKEFNTDGKASKFESNRRSQRGAMDKIAIYSKKALGEQTGYGALAGYAKAGKQESPADSVIKYSNELKKLRKKK